MAFVILHVMSRCLGKCVYLSTQNGRAVPRLSVWMSYVKVYNEVVTG
jgi:hypothetical protein